MSGHTYAILGATGNTGLCILKQLDESSKANIHVLVRSRAKLERLYPALSSRPNIKVFEASISDTDTVARCLAGTKAAFLTVAVPDNMPACTLAQDTAHAVVSALKSLKTQESSTFKPPRLIVLSASSLDDKFWRDDSPLVHKFVYNAMFNLYADLEKAEAYLREQEDWLSSTFIMPGGLTHDVQQGHELSVERQQTFISFMDLGAAMIEAADEESGRWDMARVSVVLKDGKKARFDWWAPVVLIMGFCCTWFPSLYPYIPH